MEKLFIVTTIENKVEQKNTLAGGLAIYKSKKSAENYVKKIKGYGYWGSKELKIVELDVDIEKLRNGVA